MGGATPTTTDDDDDEKKTKKTKEEEERSDDDDSDDSEEEEEHRAPIKISNLDDLNAIKRAYEEMFCDGLLHTEKIKETHSVSNTKIFIGSVACVFAFVAQLYPVYLKRKGGYDVKCHEDLFLQLLTLLCLCG